MSIRIEGLHKRFGDTVVCDRVDLDVASGALVALLGPSGSGKTTLLRIVAGLETPDAGRVWLGGEDATAVDVRARRVGFVFQHYALFPHMTVADNVAFGLRVRPRATRPGDAAIRAKVHSLLELVQLDRASGRYPHQLSGGQRQRVALARALAVEPKVLLLDEPFGALDAKVRKELRRWLRRLHDEVHLTTILVTHDQDEALEVADRVVVMNRGRIEQDGTPEEVYDRPATPFVLRFLGDAAAFPTAALAPGAGGTGRVAWARPHDIELLDAPAAGSVPTVLEHALTAGPNTRLALRRTPPSGAPMRAPAAGPGAADDGPIEVELPRARWVELRDRLGLSAGATVHVRPARLIDCDGAAPGGA